VDVFAARAGQLYGQDQAALAVYEQQLGEARTELDRAEAELAAFQTSNQVNILTAQLDSQQASLTDYLNRQNQVALMQQDIDDLRVRLERLSGEAPAGLAEDLALLSLANRLYGGQMVSFEADQSRSGVPLQVQVSPDRPLAGLTVADQLALADDLIETLATRREQIDGQITALEPRIMALQGQVAAAQVQEQELTRAQDLASSQYLSLASRIQEAQIAVQAWASTVQVASRAQVPTEKAGPRRTINTLLGGGVGFVLGVLVALGYEFWNAAPPQSVVAPPRQLDHMSGEGDGRASRTTAARQVDG
jgi:uncharacterized protein involved in exopolysaccharide biosynthesis